MPQQQLQPFDEGPALAEARIWASRLRQEIEVFGVNVVPLHSQSGHAFLRNTIKSYALSHPLNMAQVCTWAREGGEVAELALIDLIAEFLDRGEQLPAVLAAYNIELLHPRRIHRPTGPKKAARVLQDIAVTVLVMMVMEQYDLKPTRRQPTRPSACSIVARVLEDAGIHRGGERAVEKIWQRISPRVR